MDTLWKSRKVVIVGAGAVGSTFAYALAQKGLADQICLIDANPDFAEGQALDLAHGLPFYPSVQIRAGDSRDYADAQVIVITAGAKQAPGESRLNLLQKNAAIVEAIVDEIVAQKSQAVLLLASNPVDILTHVALKRSGWPKNRVIGSGTVLDSARFRYLISQHCKVDVGNVHAYILGEHGDSEVAAWSMTHVAGVPMDNYCPHLRQLPRLARRTRPHCPRSEGIGLSHHQLQRRHLFWDRHVAGAHCRNNFAGPEQRADRFHLS